MKRRQAFWSMGRTVSLIVWTCVATAAWAGGARGDFNKLFCDSTLRLNLLLAGDSQRTEVFLSSIDKQAGWAGPHRVMPACALGNGQVQLIDRETKEVIYVQPFNMLFEEWVGTPEARQVAKAMEQVVLVPMPKRPVDVSFKFRHLAGPWQEKLVFPLNPKDELIKDKSRPVHPAWSIQHNGDVAKCIDIVMVGEGYSRADSAKWHADAVRLNEALFRHEPFKSLRRKFNVIAVDAWSAESGVSEPDRGIWRNTLCGTHYDTFYSARYLMTDKMFAVHDAIAGHPCEYVMIICNTPRYGGGGIFNSHTLVSSDNDKTDMVYVHEFGHAFCGLGDEYAYSGDEEPYYDLSVEPWEENITSKVDLKSKWQDMIDRGVKGVGLFEGAGYMPKGMFRPCEDCRMKTNEAPDFCPVCTRAIRNYVKRLTE